MARLCRRGGFWGHQLPLPRGDLGVEMGNTPTKTVGKDVRMPWNISPLGRPPKNVGPNGPLPLSFAILNNLSWYGWYFNKLSWPKYMVGICPLMSTPMIQWYLQSELKFGELRVPHGSLQDMLRENPEEPNGIQRERKEEMLQKLVELAYLALSGHRWIWSFVGGVFESCSINAVNLWFCIFFSNERFVSIFFNVQTWCREIETYLEKGGHSAAEFSWTSDDQWPTYLPPVRHRWKNARARVRVSMC